MTVEFRKVEYRTNPLLECAKLEVGDKFVQVTYAPYGSGLTGVIPVTVEKVGKRDILLRTGSGGEQTIKVKDELSTCYAIDDPQVAVFRTERRAKIRGNKVYAALKDCSPSFFDEEFLTAAEAFLARREAKAEKKEV